MRITPFSTVENTVGNVENRGISLSKKQKEAVGLLSGSVQMIV